jgi:hypothetical protein
MEVAAGRRQSGLARGGTGTIEWRRLVGRPGHLPVICICLVFMYIWPGMTLWLPEFLYGK